MADDNTTGAGGGAPATGNSPPADDLRSLIAGITTESKKEQPAEPPAGGTGEASPSPPSEPARPTPERGRGGRFVAAGEQPSEPERKEPLRPPPEPGGEPPGEGDKGPVPPKEAAQPAAGERQTGPKETGAPEDWSAGDKAMFNAWQPAVRDQFLTMYKRMEGGFTQRLQRSADLERGFGEIEQLFQPYGEMLRQRNMTPKDIIKTWHEVERNLSLPTEQNQVIAKMIHNYQADPAQIARYLNQLRFADPGGGQGQPPSARIGNGADPATGIHPALAARLDALETDRTQRIQADDNARLQDAHRQINEFANAKDVDGNLAHPHYAELEGEMMQLAYADRVAGRTPVIANLYDRAAWANPGVRDKLLASQREAEDRTQAAARKAKAEAAARAGSSVTGAPSSGQVPNSAAPDRSIRDEIRAHMTGNGSGRV